MPNLGNIPLPPFTSPISLPGMPPGQLPPLSSFSSTVGTLPGKNL